jgi:predicted chitinase
MPDFRRQPNRVPVPRPRPADLGQRPGSNRPGPGQGPARGNDAALQQMQTQDQGRVQGQAATPGEGTAGVVVDELLLDAAVTALLAVVPQDLRTYAEGHLPGIVQQCAWDHVTNANQVAYILATAEHESKFGRPAFSWSQPLVEDHNQYRQQKNGKWRASNHVSGGTSRGDTEAELDEDYWDDAYGGRLGNQSGTSDAANYRGRGYVQITGRENYQRMSNLLREEGFTYTLDDVRYGTAENPIDLIAHPDHVNRSSALAAKLLVYGSTEGTYTGKALSDYVNDEETDFTNARRVINGDVEENGASIASIAQRYAAVLTTLWPQVFTTRQAGPR